MDKRSRIYTKTGDDGTTGLVGGSRVRKYDIRLEAYGTVDELNSSIGVIRTFIISPEISDLLIEVQNKLFNIGSRLASDEKGDEFTAQLSILDEHIAVLERAIDKFEEELPALSHFILPGGSKAAAQCHVARTICRRAERHVLELAAGTSVQPEIIKYLNRLSDFLFVLARKLNKDEDVIELPWKHL